MKATLNALNALNEALGSDVHKYWRKNFNTRKNGGILSSLPLMVVFVTGALILALQIRSMM